MKKAITFFVLTIITLLVVGDAMAQSHGDHWFAENRWRRSQRNYVRNGGWSYRPDPGYISPDLVIPMEIYAVGYRGHNRPFYNNSYGNYGYWGGGGEWVPIAVTGIEAGAGILINNKNQNTIRRGMDQDYNVRMRELDIQESRELREFEARQERQQTSPPRETRSYEPQVQTESRSRVVRNLTTCDVDIFQNKAYLMTLAPGEYKTIYVDKGNGPLKFGGTCKTSPSYTEDGAIIISGR